MSRRGDIPVSRRVGRRVVPQMESARASRSSQPAAAPRSARRARPFSSDLRYAFDNTMARGTPALVGWLALVDPRADRRLHARSSLIVGIAPDNQEQHPAGVVGQVFNSLLHALDPGTIAGDGGAGRSWS